jgi:5'-3' exonuclease
VVICNDGIMPTWRRRLFAGYKKRDAPQLQKNKVHVNELMPEILDMFRTAGHPVIEVPYVEADDIIGILATRITRVWKIPVVIVSNDGDYQSLLSETVSILCPGAGDNNYRTLTPDTFRSTYGFEPSVFPHFKAITGDSSDTLRGIAGLGPVKATTLIQAGVRLDRDQSEEFQELLTPEQWEQGRQTFALVNVPRRVYDLPDAKEQYGVNQALRDLEHFNQWVSCTATHRARLQQLQQNLSVYDVDARELLQYADVVNKWRPV